MEARAAVWEDVYGRILLEAKHVLLPATFIATSASGGALVHDLPPIVAPPEVVLV